MSETRDYMYTEQVQIPSKGLLNPEIPDGLVTLRCVEIRDQKYLGGTKLLHSNKAVELVRRCVIHPENLDISNLTQIDLFYLLIKLRILSYGSTYKFLSKCPICGNTISINLDLTELQVKQLETFDPNDLKIKLPRRGDTVYTHVQTQGDTEEITKEVARLKAKFKDNLDGDPEVTLSIAKIITKIELLKPDSTGAKVLDNPVDILRYVESLTDLDALAIQSTLDTVDFGVNPLVNATCDNCNSETFVPLKTTSEFFRPRFNK